MKGKNLSNKDYFELGLGGLFTGFGGTLYETEEENKSRRPFNLKTKDYEIDTCFTPDTGYWETGIQHNNLNDGDWIIVDEYENKEEAEIGHKKWIKYMKTNPKKLWEIRLKEWIK